MIIIGSNEKDISIFYKDVRKAAIFRFPHSRESGVSIFVGKQPKQAMAQLWPILKRDMY